MQARFGGKYYWRIETDAKVSFLGFSRSIQSDFDWFDPIVGARAHYHINDKISILAQGDVGGFAVGSDLTWQALATINYSFNDKLTVSAGYKVLSVDYENDGHVFDATLKGPVLGLTIRF
ncbi:hypothetical protein [Sinorhizobium fredii]|uniref:hypothetical protein n=1 Tax=Rhizobium fredii TaxID=380 RepID=UPI0035113D66